MTSPSGWGYCLGANRWHSNQLTEKNGRTSFPYTCPRELRLLAIWAYHHRAARFGKQSIGMPLAVLHELGPWLSQGRSIVAGDFNHSVWDTGDPIKDFSAINAFLENLGLSSAYQGHRNENFGKSRRTHCSISRIPRSLEHLTLL
jgi:hypothetical protein